MEKSNRSLTATSFGAGGGLQHVQPLDDDDVRPSHDDPGVGHDVVAHVRIERCAHLGGARLHLGEELQQRAAVVRLGEALALHQPAPFELGVRVEESVGGHQFDARRARPPAHQLAQQSRDRRFSHGHGSGYTHDERRCDVFFVEERARRGTQPLRRRRVEAEQPAQRQVHLAHLGEVEAVADAAELYDLGLAQRLVEPGGQSRPFGPSDLAVRRQGQGGVGGGHGIHRIGALRRGVTGHSPISSPASRRSTARPKNSRRPAELPRGTATTSRADRKESSMS